MTQYNIFQAIFMSFYSKKLYKDVALNWGGKAFLYLFFLLALSWIVFTYQAQVMLSVYYNQYSDQFVNQIPVLNIVNGEINTPENRPYFISDPSYKAPLVVIDTSGKYTQIDQVNARMLITKTELITQDNDETRIHKLSKDLSITIDPIKINEYIKTYIIAYFWIMMFIVCWIGSYIYRIIQALLYSIIGKIVGSIFHIALSYSQIMTIAMVSITPVIIISSILLSLKIYFPYQYWMYFFLGIFYLCYGILANEKSK